jgi:MFS family permease
MTKQTTAAAKSPPTASEAAPWLALIVIVLAQMQMAFNVNAIPVSVGPIVDDLNTSATSVGTALVIYSLFVAAFVMVGAKLGKIFGARLIFQVAALAHGVAMALMAFSSDVRMMNMAQAIAGVAAAALVPTLVVLIAANYHGRQQAQALGILAGTPAISGALAFFIAGYLGTVLSWRYSFGILFFLSLVVFALSFRLQPVPRQEGTRIDYIGAVLSAVAVLLLIFGFNNLLNWGIFLARPAAPFTLLGLSPALLFVVIGLMLFQAFFAWSHQRVKLGDKPLLALEVLDSPQERSGIVALLIIGALGPAVNFLIPLYIQIVQGQTSLFTSIVVIPYTLAIATAAILIVRFYNRFTPRQIGVLAFLAVTVGLTILAFTIRGEWGTPIVILGLIILGLGEGSLLTLLFNVLVSESPKELAGDVGALRGVANNMSTALGTAFASIAAVGFLSLIVTSLLAQSALPNSLRTQINLDSIDFITNEQLETYLDELTEATPGEIAEAVQINIDARLRALKASFLILAGFSLLAIFPALGLPDYSPGEIPLGPESPAKTGKFRRKRRPQSGDPSTVRRD